MEAILPAYIFLLGTIIGSFLNVVIFRAYSGRGLSGRSSCGSCSRTLGAVDLVPIFSYLFLRGRCRTCGSKISMQYPLVELATGVLFLVSFLHAQNTYELVTLLTLSILAVLISTYDIRHTVIPDAWSYMFSVAAIGWRIPEVIAGTQSIGDIILGGIIMSASLWAVWFISKGRWIGFGDVKLIFGVGALLGVFGAFMTLWLACIIGSVVGMALLMTQYLKGRSHYVTMQTQLAFGPFILVSAGLILFEYISLTQLWNLLYIV